MKILLVDDQELVLLSLEKYLTDLGYEIKCSSNMADAISLYDEFLPDLVITDLNIPVIPNSSFSFKSLDYIKELAGLEIVKYIKIIKKNKIPVMILSGNNNNDIVLKGFALGADDYMKKPLSLDEISKRIERLLGIEKRTNGIHEKRLIQRKCIGVVIPFYNLEDEFVKRDYAKLIHYNLGYHLCFVNMNNDNNTGTLLELIEMNKERVSVYNCNGKLDVSEAVRLGMLHLLKVEQFDFIGFINPDLDVNFRDFHELVQTISSSNLKLVSGSRPDDHNKDSFGSFVYNILGRGINWMIKNTTKMEFNDALCGAKIMSKDLIEKTFSKKFLTNKSFDIEILMRTKQIYGEEKAVKVVSEQLLKRWVKCDRIPVSLVDVIKTIFQIGKIAIHYK
jgi:CheY-like chemotaxis protein